MEKWNKISLYSVLFLFVFFLSGCGNKQKKEFNRLLVELADADATIGAGDWKKITDYLDSHQAKWHEFYKDGQINADAVTEYISQFFSHRRPPKEIAFIGIGEKEYFTVNFYLERSGSMTPYDAPHGDGSFKAAIVQLLNNLPGNNDDNRIYVVNSSVNKYPQGFSKFISDPNIFESTKGLGDPSYTDFSKIFTDLLNKTGKNELSILVTDMIYSTKSMLGINPQKVFAEAQGMTNAVFKAQVKDKSMLIIKMRGSYQGPYYSYNAPSTGKNYSGYRPYYIVIVGSNANMARLSKDKNYASFCHFSELRGYQNMYLFDTNGIYHPYYSLLLNDPKIRGRFHPEHGQGTQITRIKDISPDKNSGDLRLALAVDLSGMFIDDHYLTDPSNYQISSDDDLVIKEIKRISSRDVKPNERQYLGSATHLFILEMKQVSHDQDVAIQLVNRLPGWVQSSSNDDDTNLSNGNFSNTTFGLKYLLQGIYDSYQKNSDGTPYYFKMDLKFSK